MKIAVTAHGTDASAMVDLRFGRAENFVLYDQDNNSWESLPNTQNVEAAHGAGIQAGQNVAKTGAKVLITGYVGPKAFKVLQTENISIYLLGELEGTVTEALDAFQSGKLMPFDESNS